MPTNNENSILPDNRFSLTEIREFMFEKIVPIRELFDKKGNPLFKITAYWRRHNLLPFVPEAKWMNISFAQLIWLRILDDLREISFPLPKMLMVCDYFFKDAYNDDLPKKNLLLNKEQIKKKIAAGTQTDEDEAFILQIEETLKYSKALQILKFDVNYLSNFIAASLSQDKEGLIYIYFDGRVREFIGDNYMSHKKDDIDRLEPHICLSLTHYLKEFIRDDELSSLFMPQILNEEEQKVLQEMRKKNIKQITIILNKETPPRVESTTTGVMTEKQTKAIKEILGLKNYEQIILDTKDEKTLSFKKTRKKI